MSAQVTSGRTCAIPTRSSKTRSRERLEVVRDAVREALVTGSPRLVASLAPVVVRNVDRVNIARLRADLAKIGLDHRLSWLLDNTAEAIRLELAHSVPRVWAQRYRRALVVLEAALARASPRRPSACAQRPCARRPVAACPVARPRAPVVRRVPTEPRLPHAPATCHRFSTLDSIHVETLIEQL